MNKIPPKKRKIYIDEAVAKKVEEIALQYDITIDNLLKEALFMIAISTNHTPQEGMNVDMIDKLITAPNVLNSKWRKRELVLRRQAAMTLHYLFGTRTLAEIGDDWCKDHVTVMYSIRQMKIGLDIRDSYVLEIFNPVFQMFFDEYAYNKTFYAFLPKESKLKVETTRERLERYGFKTQ